MRVGVIGINHRLADLKLREQLAIACQKRFGFLQSVHDNQYFILLSTCNRTEIYFSSDDLPSTHTHILSQLRMDVDTEEEFDHKLYSFFGIDCFNHLVRVTTGLDSAIIGETDIQGQVKSAYISVINDHHLPADMHFVFQKSLGVAKKIRADLQLGRGMPNLEDAILQTGRHFFSNAEDVRVLFFGASAINQKIMEFLKAKAFSKITLCNRTNQQALMIERKLDVSLLNWSERHEWINYDWVIFGTKSPEYLIGYDDVRGKRVGNKLIMDLCVPRNVDPKLALNPRMTLLNIDQINRQLQMRHLSMTATLAEAESRIIDSTKQHAVRFKEKLNFVYDAVSLQA